jgi:hypothetical protein
MENNELVILRPGEAPTILDLDEYPGLYKGGIHILNSSDGTSASILVSAETLPSEPAFISLTPDSGLSAVDVSRVFSLVVGDGDGYEDISKVQFVIKDGIGTKIEVDSIGLEYQRSDNRIWLYNSSTGRWSRGAPGSDVILENDLCLIDLSQTTVEGDGGVLTINWHITPKSTFIGNQKIWARISDFDGNRTDSMEIGSWIVNE